MSIFSKKISESDFVVICAPLSEYEKIFSLCNKYLKNGDFMGKLTVCVQSLTFFAKKALFSIQLFRVKTLDYKAIRSAIFTTG